MASFIYRKFAIALAAGAAIALSPQLGSAQQLTPPQKVELIIAGLQASGRPLAAQHLRHWRNASGQTRFLPASAVIADPNISNFLMTYRARYIDAANRDRLQLGQSKSYNLLDSMPRPMNLRDLTLAVGGCSMHSSARLSVVRMGQINVLRFDDFKVKLQDEYKWSLGDVYGIPGVTPSITGLELLGMERVGQGKSYWVVSDWVTVGEARLIAPAPPPR